MASKKRIQPGARVEVFAFRFYTSQQEAERALGTGWRTKKEVGVVQEAVGRGMWKVK